LYQWVTVTLFDGMLDRVWAEPPAFGVCALAVVVASANRSAAKVSFFILCPLSGVVGIRHLSLFKNVKPTRKFLRLKRVA
jgi:hypothetical protein